MRLCIRIRTRQRQTRTRKQTPQIAFNIDPSHSQQPSELKENESPRPRTPHRRRPRRTSVDDLQPQPPRPNVQDNFRLSPAAHSGRRLGTYDSKESSSSRQLAPAGAENRFRRFRRPFPTPSSYSDAVATIGTPSGPSSRWTRPKSALTTS